MMDDMADMNLEENRLRTFHLWPSNAPIEAEFLAKNGFFATGNYMEAQCNWCHKKISDWQYGDQITVRHRQLDSLCPFILNSSNSGNVPLTPPSNTSNEVPDETITTSPLSSEISVENIQQTNSQENPTVPQSDLKNEMCRLATFKNWPNPNISPQSLAKAGFYYINRADQVKCAWCQGIIAKWEKNDNAFDEHQRFFPDCPRVKLGPLIEIASDGIRDLGIQQISPPRKPKYSSLDARLRTYSRWPIGEIQKPEILAQAGFYYQQIDDQVRCFHCNGGLRSWQKEDDPWFEHAKWFPLCQFLKLVKGQAYINQVQELGRQNCHESTTANSDAAGVRLEQPPMSLDEAMVSEPVRQALEMGLNEGRIRNATKRQLDYYGKPFETTEELVEAVLEGQTNEEDDTSNDLSSSIVREVSRILNNIFSPRNRSDSDNFEENTSSLTEDDEDSSSVTVGFYRNSTPPSHTTNIDTNINSSSDFVRSNGTGNLNLVPDINCSPSPSTLSQRQQDMNDPITNMSSITSFNSSTTTTILPSDTDAAGISQSSSNPNITQASIPTSTKLYSEVDLKKQLSLEEENRKLKDARLCKVCMDEEVGVVFLPCGHLVTCVQCAPGVNQCPLCRSAIKGLVRTFLS